MSEDSDGPVEFCRPVSPPEVPDLADRYAELTLRTEPAHDEAVVHLGTEPIAPTRWQLITESLTSWAEEHERQPAELGVRVTYLFAPPRTAERVPDVDLAVPLA